MAAKRRTGLLVDASVAVINRPLESKRLAFLREVLRICHGFVATGEILSEWKNHATRHAREWQASMVARKKWTRFEATRDENLRAAISTARCTEADRKAMVKDAHLIEAALQTGSPIISTDDSARALFKKLAKRLPGLRRIVWVNPIRQEEHALDWLEEGPKPVPRRTLGAGSKK